MKFVQQNSVNRRPQTICYLNIITPDTDQCSLCYIFFQLWVNFRASPPIYIFRMTDILNLSKKCIISMPKKFPIDEYRDEGVESPNHMDCQATPTMQFLNDQAPQRNAHKYKSRNNSLSSIVFRYKVFKHVNNFVRKLRMNSTLRDPVKSQNLQLEFAENPLDASWLLNKLSCRGEHDGVFIGNAGMIAWSVVNIIQITLMVFIYSVIITFPETQENSLWLYFRIFSISLYLVDMVLNFIVKRYDQGRYLQKISQISAYYIKNDFVIDLITILIFPIDIIVTAGTNVELIIFGTAIVKLVSSIRKFNKFEYLMFSSSQRQHYLGLLKILLINFAIGHFLSICLNNMARVDPRQNWYYKVGIQDSSWAVKYIWGYYWGTNIMLTVGFGDLCATNYYEALILIFVQTFSCITLAYNISSVGTLVSSIRENDKVKKRKLQIFHQMCKQNSTPNHLQSKITNFIEEKYKIKESFQYGTHDEIMEVLPEILAKEFISCANQNLFESLRFFKDLPKKGLKQLAAHIKRKVCHPEQIVLKKGRIPDFVVLRHGCLSLTCEIDSKINGKQIQMIEVKQGGKPIILAADFIKNQPLNYNVKSKTFSVVFFLSQADIMGCLKGSKLSYEMLCMMRDKHDYVDDGILQCQICKNESHSKFECSRLHYVPLQSHIILRHIHKSKVAKQPRHHLFNRVKLINSSLMERNHIMSAYTKLNTANQELMSFCIPRLIENYQTTDYKANTISQAFDADFVSTFESNMKNMGNSHRKKHVSNFWELETDSAKNFKFYFAQSNPNMLSSKKCI